jgi:hypothetical protein
MKGRSEENAEDLSAEIHKDHLKIEDIDLSSYSYIIYCSIFCTILL